MSKSKQAAQKRSAPPKKKKSAAGVVRTGIVRLLLIVLETLLLAFVAVYAALYILTNGPSVTAREQFTLSMHETSALKFLPGWFLSDEEIAEISAIETKRSDLEYAETDTSLVTIDTAPKTDPADGPVTDKWGLVDDDGDGIILEQVHGEGFYGYMMVVLDPSRVIMGSEPGSFEREGYTVAEFVQHFDGVAGINAGGFLDAGGRGNGATPDSMVVFKGKIYYAQYGLGVYNCFVGFDDEYKMHVGKLSRADVEAAHIRYGVCFGPALVINGEPADPNGFDNNQNPRTAIGQRSDGAVLMLVIVGRQATSTGAGFQDLVDIMLNYGAVNACNLDGGSSSLLWYNGGYVNNAAHIVGIRDVPTSFVVLKEGVSADD